MGRILLIVRNEHSRPAGYLHEAQLNPGDDLQSTQAEVAFKAFDAKVENNFRVLSEPHFGHLTVAVVEDTSSSNFSLHSWQLNSYSGILFHSRKRDSRTGCHTKQ
jgi:hypothetical protein